MLGRLPTRSAADSCASFARRAQARALSASLCARRARAASSRARAASSRCPPAALAPSISASISAFLDKFFAVSRSSAPVDAAAKGSSPLAAADRSALATALALSIASHSAVGSLASKERLEAGACAPSRACAPVLVTASWLLARLLPRRLALDGTAAAGAGFGAVLSRAI